MSDFNFFSATTIWRFCILGIWLGTIKNEVPTTSTNRLNQVCKDTTLLHKYLKEGGNPDARLENNRTFSRSHSYHSQYPLLLCVSDEGAEILLKHGANPNVEAGGQTPLQKAFNSKNVKLMKLLLKYGANPNPEPFNKTFLLHQAISNGEEEIAKILLKNGADVNVKNRIKETPLDVAARRYQVEIAEILIEKGAVANRQSGSRNLSRLRQQVHKLKLKRYRLRLKQIKQQRKKLSSD